MDDSFSYGPIPFCGNYNGQMVPNSWWETTRERSLDFIVSGSILRRAKKVIQAQVVITIRHIHWGQYFSFKVGKSSESTALATQLNDKISRFNGREKGKGFVD
jgi:TolB-like protein